MRMGLGYSMERKIKTGGFSWKVYIFTGYIIDDGGSSILSRGFFYGDSPVNLINNLPSGETSQSFTASSKLISGTVYYKAYAENSEGMGYGEIKSLII